MFCLLLLFSPEGFFGFVQIKKTKKLLMLASHASAAPSSSGDAYGWL
jgi:hypothetical protein